MARTKQTSRKRKTDSDGNPVRKRRQLASKSATQDRKKGRDPTRSPTAHIKRSDHLPSNNTKKKTKKKKKKKKKHKSKKKFKKKHHKASSKKSDYRGVWWDPTKGKWRAVLPGRLTSDGKWIFLGCHAQEKQAAMAINAKCLELGVPLMNDVDKIKVKKEIVKKERVESTSSGILTAIEYELDFAEVANEEFMETHFQYGNVALKSIRALHQKAKALAAENQKNFSEMNLLLKKVLDLNSEIRQSIDHGVKREDLFLPSAQNTTDDDDAIIDSKSELYNVLSSVGGYPATLDAIKILEKERASDKHLDICRAAEKFKNLTKEERKKVLARLKENLQNILPTALEASSKGFDTKPGLIIKKSTVCDGLGLFAEKQLFPGDVAGVFIGKLMTMDEAEMYCGGGNRDTSRAHYIMTIEVGKETLVIDPFQYSGTVNHAGVLGDATPSEKENMQWVPIIYKGYPYLAEVITRSISPGEEILTNYGETYRADPFLDEATHPRTLKMKSRKVYFAPGNRFFDLTDDNKLPALESPTSLSEE